MIIRSIIVFTIILVFILLIFLLFSTLDEYKPSNKEILHPETFSFSKTLSDSIISLMTWNIGYASMGSETDFFYDGGKMVRPNRELHEKYLDSIVNFFQPEKAPNFILLQEVDYEAKRSYFSNEKRPCN